MKKTEPALGFITVVEQQPHGLIGGYLLLNVAGRPLEFHCTAPIKPNRAQQILYGPTLEPFLYGELIGRTLVEAASQGVLAIFTDQPPVLALAQYVEVQVVLVTVGATNAEEVIGRELQSRLESLGATIDLAEPFNRIRDAVVEAQRTSRAA